MSAPTATNSGVDKLSLIIAPIVNENGKMTRDHITAVMQEILVQLAVVTTKLEVLEKLQSADKKKPAARTKAAAADGTPTDAAPAPAVFQNNKLNYFRACYKTDAAFRAKYTNDAIKAAILADASIQARTTETTKLVAEGTLCWNLIKRDHANLMEEIERDFAAAKAAHENANKPAQQTADERTPQ